MSDDLFGTETLTTSHQPPAAAPREASAPSVAAPAVDDLFDLGGDRAPKTEGIRPPSAPAKVEATISAAPVEPPPPAAKPAASANRYMLWIAFAILINAAVAGYVIYKFESKTSELTRIIKQSGPAQRTDVARPEEGVDGHRSNNKNNKNTAEPAENVKLTNGAGAELNGEEFVPAGHPPAQLETANALFTQGFFSQARKKYYEALLHLPPGYSSREFELAARLGVARCLARELASETSPIRTRFSNVLAISEDRE